MQVFTSKVVYNEKDEKRMLDTVQGIANPGNNIRVVLMAAVLFIGGLLNFQTQILCSMLIVFGWIVVMNENKRREDLAGDLRKRLVGEREGVLLYRFGDPIEVQIAEKTNTHSYSSVQFLIEDQKYFYLVFSEHKIMPVSKLWLQPGDVRLFKKQMAERTKHRWHRSIPWIGPIFLKK